MKLLVLLFALTTVVLPEKNFHTQRGNDNIVMPAIFSDNMVLQQKEEVPIWGKANPGDSVQITASWGQTAKTIVGSDSLWMMKLETIKAGGPYTLNVSVGDSTIVYKNVMLGEVWLCSGQSNMEEPLTGWPPLNPIHNSSGEIQAANYPNIRLFTVEKTIKNVPNLNCVGSWHECNPKTAAHFSAVAYFFGRKLYKELHVPIGLIVSSWGGTKIQSWISGKYLGAFSGYKPIVNKLEKSSLAIKKLRGWIHKHRVIDVSEKPTNVAYKNLSFDDGLCARPNFNDSKWRNMKLPTYWESTRVGNFDGAVWFRKKIDIPESWIGKSLVLDLGPIDDMDESYVNGTFVGGYQEEGYYNKPRVYSVPASVVKDTVLTLAIRVLDTGGGGGIWGGSTQMQVHPKGSNQNIALSGTWKYLPVAEYIAGKFYVYGISKQEFDARPKLSFNLDQNTPTVLYNGMIAPLIPYYIKGTIWYQGEQNTDDPKDYNNYHALFSMLIHNWRTVWGEGNFPFYFVQIAPWKYGSSSKSYVVRNAQFQTLSVPNTGMAVTLDIGSLKTIHPPDKQDMGKRLALWALAKQYHKNVFYSGPLFKSMKIKGNKIILSFNHAGKGLVVKDRNGKTNFIIAGLDKKFVDAQVKVKGKKLIVYSNKIKHPVAVRYAWSNTEKATLFNKEGLPAPTFKTDNWPTK